MVLHDHLDGGLRVSTLLELADAVGHRLPVDDADELGRWFDQSGAGSLEAYLTAFEHTTAVMQTEAAIERVAYEALVDLADDGVVYAEVRFDPGLCTASGLDRHAVVEAAVSGCQAARRQTGIVFGLIVTALRHHRDADLNAEVAAHFIDDGVVGFDLAGPEAGFPSDDHLSAILIARRAGLGVTIHAGEGDGPHAMWRALALCGAQRIGHGVRVVEDMAVDDGEIVGLGPVARRVRDHRIPLELSVTSNVQTGAVRTQSDHPIATLQHAGFNVTINTDNRLMSGTTMSAEYLIAHDLGMSVAELGDATVAALEAGFGAWPDRRRLIDDVVRPAYTREAPLRP